MAQSSSSFRTSDARITELARVCREAWLPFMREKEWGKKELAAWLIGEYGFALTRSKQVLPSKSTPPPGEVRMASTAPPPLESEDPLDEKSVRQVIDLARHEVFGALGAIEVGDESFVNGLVQLDFVSPVLLENGRDVFIPRSRVRMRLADRLLSLVACDLAAIPDDFRRLHACKSCNLVTFDGTCVHDARGVGPDEF